MQINDLYLIICPRIRPGFQQASDTQRNVGQQGITRGVFYIFYGGDILSPVGVDRIDIGGVHGNDPGAKREKNFQVLRGFVQNQASKRKNPAFEAGL